MRFLLFIDEFNSAYNIGNKVIYLHFVAILKNQVYLKTIFHIFFFFFSFSLWNTFLNKTFFGLPPARSWKVPDIKFTDHQLVIVKEIQATATSDLRFEDIYFIINFSDLWYIYFKNRMTYLFNCCFETPAGFNLELKFLTSSLATFRTLIIYMIFYDNLMIFLNSDVLTCRNLEFRD